MKKILLIFSLIFALLLGLTSCTTEVNKSANWSKTIDNVTECGGTYNGTPYKAVAIYMENPTEEEADNTIEGKVAEGYDVALAYFMEGNLQFRIDMDTNKGYTNADAQWIVNELVKRSEATGTFEDEIFVETIKDFMENRK